MDHYFSTVERKRQLVEDPDELSEDAVMKVINDLRPSFRDPFDKIAFALHASFHASGYDLLATGQPAVEHPRYRPSLPDKVAGIHGWNELEEEYAFLYSKWENHLKKIVHVRCFGVEDDLEMVAVLCREKLKVTRLDLNVADYTKENQYTRDSDSDGTGIDFSHEYKNFNKLVKTLNSDILCWMRDPPTKEEPLKIDAGTSSSAAHVVYHHPPSEVDEACNVTKSTEHAVMAVIRASHPSFRNAFDKIAFAVHAFFLSSGYNLLATGDSALQCNYASSPPPAEVGVKGWNEVRGVYGFLYSKLENNLKKIVHVVCFVDGIHHLVISAVCEPDDIVDIVDVAINVKDYTKENYGSSVAVSDEYKNFKELLNTLNSDIMSRIKDSPKKEESLGSV